jgi:hypothetical protein
MRKRGDGSRWGYRVEDGLCDSVLAQPAAS